MTANVFRSRLIFLGQDEKGNTYINTLWQPNKGDIEAILAGRPIYYSISLWKRFAPNAFVYS